MPFVAMRNEGHFRFFFSSLIIHPHTHFSRGQSFFTSIRITHKKVTGFINIDSISIGFFISSPNLNGFAENKASTTILLNIAMAVLLLIVRKKTLQKCGSQAVFCILLRRSKNGGSPIFHFFGKAIPSGRYSSYGLAFFPPRLHTFPDRRTGDPQILR